MKRAVLIFGAGASLEFGAPSTSALTQEIEDAIKKDEFMQHVHGDIAFDDIKAGLLGYLKGPVNFEQIYHCAHELIAAYSPSHGAVDEFRPLLYPFTVNATSIQQSALFPLCSAMTSVIYKRMSEASSSTKLAVDPLSVFISRMKRDFITRIYTTNYDDFITQADGTLYTGFDSGNLAHPRRFLMDEFWLMEDKHSLSHLHGSVHFGFPHDKGEIGELFWFDDRAEALQHSDFYGSGTSRMDGSDVVRTSVITGLDKLSRIQQRPMAHYYAALARDIMRADIIYVIGSGLSDLHINSWLHEARSVTHPAPLLFIDYWKRGFRRETAFEFGRKEVELWHKLNVSANGAAGIALGSGWTISHDRTSAVWDKGFQKFLAASTELDEVLLQITAKV